MASGFSSSIKMTGESEYKRALQDITTQLRLFSSEMKVTTSSFEKGDTAMEQMKNRSKTLNAQISAQVQKIIELNRAVSLASDAYGENDKRTVQWKIKLNEAHAELNNLNKALDENEKNMKDYAEGAENASKGTSMLGDMIKAKLISETIIDGVKMLGNAMLTVGKSLIGIGKQAVDSYGEYEQLYGGIQAMFGGLEKGAEQINTVVVRGKQAWADMNMSEIDYYNTFISTYPLIKNSIDDQNKAIETTNRMLQLESDLANTFGYDMSTASLAINWALKGSFQYIDNLNLGIKGTKEGFLEASHAVGYMVSSVDELTSDEILDILEKYAQQYGVMGRTANESAGTIQGSMKAVKATWSNLITGVADDTADFGTLVDNFVTSVVAVSGNILPRVQNAVGGIGQLISGLGKVLLDNLPAIIEQGKTFIKGLGAGIMQALPNLMPVVSGLIVSIGDFIKEEAPQMIANGLELITELGQGLIEGIPEFLSGGYDMLQQFADYLTENVPILIQTGIGFIRNMVQGLVQALPEFLARVPLLISQFANLINDNAPTIIQGGISIIWDLIKGLIGAIPDLIANIPQIIQAILDVWQAFNWVQLGQNVVKFLGDGITSMIGFAKSSIGNIKDNIVNFIKDLPSNLYNIGKNGISGLGNAFKSMIGFIKSSISEVATGLLNTLKSMLSWDNLKSIGTNMIKGLWNGISDMTGWILDKVKGFGESVLGGIKKFFGIHSPSTVFRDQIGKNLALGLGEGFTGTMKSVSDSMIKSVPTEYEIDPVKQPTAELTGGRLVGAVADALKNVKVVMNDREMGAFVVNTVGKVVYS